MERTVRFSIPVLIDSYRNEMRLDEAIEDLLDIDAITGVLTSNRPNNIMFINIDIYTGDGNEIASIFSDLLEVYCSPFVNAPCKIDEFIVFVDAFCKGALRFA